MTLRFLAIVCALVFCMSANAATFALITNGGFESGLLGWNVAGTAGSDDAFTATSATTTPLNGFPTVGPFAGLMYAVSDQSGLVTPESTTLTQTVAIPVGTTSAVLSLEMFVNDQFGASGLGGEVGIWAGSANPLTTAPLFVAFGPIDTTVAGGNPNPYIAYSLDVISHLTPGLSYKVGVLESDLNGPINVGVDNVSLVATTSTTTTPEPGMLLPIGFLAAGMLLYRARRNAAQRI